MDSPTTRLQGFVHSNSRGFLNEALSYHQDGHIIGVASVAEATEGADVVPTSQHRCEGSATEGSGCWCGANTSGVVTVQGCAPAGQGLGKGWHYTGWM